MVKHLITFIMVVVLFIGVPCGTHAAVELDADDNGAVDIDKGGTNATDGSFDSSLSIGGTGDSALYMLNNATAVDDITGLYGIRFLDGVLQQIINGTPSSVGSGGSEPTIQAADPVTGDATGWYIATDNTKLFYNVTGDANYDFGTYTKNTYPGITCTGTIQAGDTETLEAVGFCLDPGFVETDVEGKIDPNSTNQPRCGLQSMHLTSHVTTTSDATATITDTLAGTFTMRYYIHVVSGVTPDFTTIPFQSLLDSSLNPENGIGVRHDTGSDYRLFFNSITASYITILPDTDYYIVINWDGSNTPDSTLMRVYDDATQTPQTATNGLDSTTLSATEGDGINFIKFETTVAAMSIYIDDFVYSSAGADLSGGSVCE